jgi:predicted enzyme related to lactoylglutathione lyase
MSSKPAVGSISWFDLTVADATSVRDFYKAVVGWTTSDVAMGEYADYCMHPLAEGAGPVAGVCHARGENADLPPVWMLYITVADLDASVAECASRGGTVVRPPKSIGSYGRMAVIRDPAGAVCALFEHAA